MRYIFCFALALLGTACAAQTPYPAAAPYPPAIGSYRSDLVPQLQQLKSDAIRLTEELRRVTNDMEGWLKKVELLSSHPQFPALRKKLDELQARIFVDPKRESDLVAEMMLGLSGEEEKILDRKIELDEEFRRMKKEGEGDGEEERRLRRRYSEMVSLLALEGISSPQYVHGYALLMEIRKEFERANALIQSSMRQFDIHR